MTELIQTAVTDELIAERNNDFADRYGRGHKSKQKILDDLATGPVEHTIAYKSLLTEYLDKHTEHGQIQTAEQIADYLDVAVAHVKSRKLAGEYGYIHRGISKEIYRSGVPKDVLARAMGEDVHDAKLAAKQAAENVTKMIEKIPYNFAAEVKRGFAQELNMPTSDMVSFVGHEIPEEILGHQDAITRGNLRIAKEVIPYEPEKVEAEIPNYLMRATRGTVAPSLLLPAVRSYFSKEYPEGLLANSRSRPDYAAATTDMLMLTLKEMKDVDKNAGSMYGMLLQQAERVSRSGRLDVRNSVKASDALRPPVGALVNLANKLSPSLEKATGRAHDPITSDGGDLQFTQAVSRITEALLFATKNPDFTVDQAEHAVASLECIDLMNGRLEQYMHARAAATRK